MGELDDHRFWKKKSYTIPPPKTHGHNWILDICHFLYFKTAPVYKPFEFLNFFPQQRSKKNMTVKCHTY